MKILKIALISFVVLIVAVTLAAVIFVKTFDINRFKPQILSQASKALGRQVNFDAASLGMSLRQGISLKISNLAIAEDPAFAKGDFLTVKDIALGVDVMKYIFKKEVDVPNVLIDSPRVAIIRLKDGRLNAMSLAKSSSGPAAVSTPALTPALTPASLPVILVSSIKADNGTILYEDRTFEPAISLEISDVTFRVDHFSLTQPFAFAIEGTVLSLKKNITAEGRAQIDLKTNEVTVSDLKVSTDLSQLFLDKIPVALPMVQGAVLPTTLKGQAEAALEKFTAGPQGVSGLSAAIALSNGLVQFKELASPIQDVAVRAHLTLSKVLIESASAAIADGTLKASGAIDDYLAAQNYDLTLAAQNLKIQELVVQDKAAIKAEGIIAVNAKAKGAGFSPEAVKSTLSGEGNISGESIKLKDINVLAVVLDKISAIPSIAQNIKDKLPEKYKQKLAQPDTALSDISLPFVIEKGRLLIRDTVIGADEFVFKGRTEVGLDGSFAAEGSFLIPQELSAALVAGATQLQYLLNTDKQIYVPVKISGKAPEMNISVDAEYIAKQLLVNQAQTQLIKVIDKALGSKEPQAPASGAAQTEDLQATSVRKEEAGADNLVSGVLDTIFKK